MLNTLKMTFFVLSLQAWGAFADQVYQLDRSTFASNEEYNYCKDLVKETIVVKDEDPGHLVIEVLEDFTKQSTKIQLIQDEKRIAPAGDGSYEGNYVDRIYLVKYDGLEIYKYGLYSSVQILSFQKGIIIEKKPLNYFSSQEMLNQISCQKIYYKRIKP